MTTRQRSGPAGSRRATSDTLSQATARPQSRTGGHDVAAGSAVARPVLVATDGSRVALAAIRFARVMEEERQWAPEALTSVEHLPVAVADVTLPAPIVVTEPSMIEASIASVRRQLRRLGAKKWTLRSALGPPVGNIIDRAKLSGAELIVLGLGRHGRLARLLGAETAARVCRHATVPVLAVAQQAKGRPQCIVVAVDFGPSSIRAAHEAIRLVRDGGRVHLVHVRWALDGAALRDEAWERTYADGVELGFARLRSNLAQRGIRITSELKRGGTVQMVLKSAEDLKADVIALGSHSQTTVDRLLLGSTPAMMLRAARCSVLVTPPESEPSRTN